MPKQKGNGEGSFRTKNGGYEYRVSLGYDNDGELIRKSFYGKRKADCKEKAEAFAEQLKNKQIALKNWTLGKWIKEWLEVEKKGTVSEGTYATYEYCTRYIINSDIANKKLIEVKSMDVTKFLKSLANYSDDVIKKTRALLFGAFECAIDNDFCFKNPVKRASTPIKPKAERETFTDTEVLAILKFAETDSFGLPLAILLTTGLRRGELLALKWDDIDFDAAVINVNKAIKANGVEGDPKNKASQAPVPMHEYLIDFLKSANKSANGKYVIQEDGKQLDRGRFRHRYDGFFKRLNDYLVKNEMDPIEKLTTHCTRHTTGTMLYRNGVDLKTIQSMLRHGNIESTGDIYVHSDVETTRKELNKVKMD